MRFVRGARASVFVAPVDGVSQVFRYWLDAGTPEQLTFDDGNKDLHSVPWMWRAPEFNDAFVFATVVEDRELRIYREPEFGAAGQPWTFVYSAFSPDRAVLNSPEPFTHNGKSYVVVGATVPPYRYPAAIFLSNIDSSEPMFRQLTVDESVRLRSDPEVFVTNAGPYVYYNRFNPDGATLLCPDPCSEGVYRSYTGLPPPN